MTMTSSPTVGQTFAETLADNVAGLAWQVRVVDYGRESGCMVEVSTTFHPGSLSAYNVAEAVALAALRGLAMRYPGSVWGSDSGSVGGHAALTSGQFHYCKSGVGKRDAQSVAKAAGVTIETRR